MLSSVLPVLTSIAATSEVIKELVEKALDPRCYAVILGGVEETTRLLERPWGRGTALCFLSLSCL